MSTTASRVALIKGTRPVTERRSSKTLDGAVAEIVHDLKAPLSTMLLEAALLEHRLDEREDVESRLRAQRIIRSVKFLDQLVEDLLDASALSAGKLALSREDIELRSLAVHVIDLVVSSRDAHRVSLEAEEPVLVHADRRRIERVLGNLIDNALKHSASSVVVGLQTLGGYSVMSVTDAGPGIDPDELVEVFEPYHRGAASRGTGLGLHTSKKIVEAHGGSIVAESTRGVGSCFCFTLPLIT